MKKISLDEFNFGTKISYLLFVCVKKNDLPL